MKNPIQKIRRSKKGFTLIEAILVAILVGLLASIGIIKAAAAKETVGRNMLDSAIKDVNMLVQRHVIQDVPFTHSVADIDAAINPVSAGAVEIGSGGYSDWGIVLDSSIAAGFITQDAAEDLYALVELGPGNLMISVNSDGYVVSNGEMAKIQEPLSPESLLMFGPFGL